MRALAILVLVSSCTAAPAPGPVEVSFPAQLPTPLDVLVVLDDTASAQTTRIPDSANLAGVLDGIYNGAPDLRIAVTTTTTGALRTSPLVPGGVIEHRVRMEDGTLATNYTGDLASAVGSLVAGDGHATGANTALASTVLALNAGNFLRNDAALGVLLVSTTDDASADAPAAYAAAIQARATKAMVSVVDGQASPRLDAFLGAMTLAYQTPVEKYDMNAIMALSWTFEPIANDSCFPVAVAHPEDCELSSAYHMVANPLRPCTGDPFAAASPCYQLAADASCPSGTSILYGGAYRYYHPEIFGRCNVKDAPSMRAP